MLIGEKIKLKRIEKKWSQRDLAEKMGYSHHSTLARIENGKIDVSNKKIVQFAQVLGTTVEYLMDLEDPETEKKSAKTDGLTENQIKLMKFVESVPADKAEMILKVIRSIVESD